NGPAANPTSDQHVEAQYRADPKTPAIAPGTAPPGSTSFGFASWLHERRQIDFISGSVQRKHARIESPVFDIVSADPADSTRPKSSNFDFRHRRVHPEVASSIGLRI